MQSTGSNLPDSRIPPKPEVGLPLWLLAELTYRCPLQCPYCSNPLDFAQQGKELSTEQWIKVFREAREMGAAQLGFSGGEPLVRQDLAELIGEGRRLGYYTNLITSGIGLTEQKIADFKHAGLDHIQISFQASDEEVNNLLAGSKKAFAGSTISTGWLRPSCPAASFATSVIFTRLPESGCSERLRLVVPLASRALRRGRSRR